MMGGYGPGYYGGQRNLNLSTDEGKNYLERMIAAQAECARDRPPNSLTACNDVHQLGNLLPLIGFVAGRNCM